MSSKPFPKASLGCLHEEMKRSFYVNLSMDMVEGVLRGTGFHKLEWVCASQERRGAARCPTKNSIDTILVAFALFTGIKILHENILVYLSNNPSFGRGEYMLGDRASHRCKVW